MALAVPESPTSVDELRAAVIAATAPAAMADGSKAALRDLHSVAVETARQRARPALARWESRLIQHFAMPSEVDPHRIAPTLRQVESPADKRLFRYASLHWSIPVSFGYGRRLRFLIEDGSNGRLIGILGLGDPVFALRDRERWIGWDSHRRAERLRHVMDAYVLGAVPPYSLLLGGKLVAALAISREVQAAFWNRYGRSTSLIAGRKQHSGLALLTTTSAFGRSSMYNRIRLRGRDLWTHVGYTRGHGEFLFDGQLYQRLRLFLEGQQATPSARHANWGAEGWRNRREVVRKALPLLGLPYDLHLHGVRRAIYVAPLGDSATEWLKGTARGPRLIRTPAEEIGREAVERWLIPRSVASSDWQEWDREELRLW